MFAKLPQQFLVLLTLGYALGWSYRGIESIRSNHRLHIIALSSKLADVFEPDEEIRYKTIVASGFLTSATTPAEVNVYGTLFESGRFESITAITESLVQAKRFLTSPSSVYSGLANNIRLVEVSGNNRSILKGIVNSADVWLANNLTLDEVDEFAEIAAESRIKRAVFTVKVPIEMHHLANVTFSTAAASFASTGVNFTIMKYGDTDCRSNKAKYPFRVLRGELPLSTLNIGAVSPEDLYKVAAEIIDIPKTFNSVYGLVRGSELDSEIAAFMTSSGWPERVKIGVLVGDVMERIETSMAVNAASLKKGGQQSEVR